MISVCGEDQKNPRYTRQKDYQMIHTSFYPFFHKKSKPPTHQSQNFELLIIYDGTTNLPSFDKIFRLSVQMAKFQGPLTFHSFYIWFSSDSTPRRIMHFIAVTAVVNDLIDARFVFHLLGSRLQQILFSVNNRKKPTRTLSERGLPHKSASAGQCRVCHGDRRRSQVWLIDLLVERPSAR